MMLLIIIFSFIVYGIIGYFLLKLYKLWTYKAFKYVQYDSEQDGLAIIFWPVVLVGFIIDYLGYAFQKNK